jgi:2-oxoisovalerate dehydrogenase E1 component
MTKAEKTHLTHAHVTDLLKGMIRIRHFEDKCAELYTQQKIRGFLHLYDGEEAIAIGVISVLGDNDRIVATYREHGHALARGVPMPEVMAEMYGKAEGCSGGRGGSMHLFHAPSNFLWRQRHCRRRPAAGRRPGARRQAFGRRWRHRLLLR